MTAPLWIVALPNAVPPLTITNDPDQRDAWIEQGAAVAVYEVTSTQIYPQQEA